MYRVMMASFNGNALPLQALLLDTTSIIDRDATEMWDERDEE